MADFEESVELKFNVFAGLRIFCTGSPYMNSAGGRVDDLG